MRIFSKIIIPTDHPFLNNKYTNWYYSIIKIAKSRETLNEYVENHHIIPDCFYINNRSKGKNPGFLDGNSNIDSNLILLTSEEHFICHWLLTKMVNGQQYYQMEKALTKLCGKSRGQDRDYTSAMYARARIAANNIRGLYSHSEDTKKKIGDGNRGKTVSNITKQLCSLANFGNPPTSGSFSIGHIPWNKGVPMSDDHKISHSTAQLKRFKNDDQKQMLIDNLIKGRQTVKDNGFKLLVITPEKDMTIYESVADYEKSTGFKQRNIYHLAYNYPGEKIEKGKYTGFTFLLFKL